MALTIHFAGNYCFFHEWTQSFNTAMGVPNDEVVSEFVNVYMPTFNLQRGRMVQQSSLKSYITMVCCLRVLHYLLRASWVASRAMRPIRVKRMAPTSCQRRNVIPWRVQIVPRGFMCQLRGNQMASTSCRRRNVIPWRVQIAARRAMQPIRVKRTAFTSCQRSYAQIACGASFGVGRCIPGKNNNEWYVLELMYS